VSRGGRCAIFPVQRQVAPGVLRELICVRAHRPFRYCQVKRATRVRGNAVQVCFPRFLSVLRCPASLLDDAGMHNPRMLTGDIA